MDRLLKIMKDESVDPEKRWRAAICYGLLGFAEPLPVGKGEPIDDKTVRITDDTVTKLQTYIALLRAKEDKNG